MYHQIIKSSKLDDLISNHIMNLTQIIVIDELLNHHQVRVLIKDTSIM